jgi:hypothetical protein
VLGGRAGTAGWQEATVGIATPAWLEVVQVPDDLRSRLDAGDAVLLGDIGDVEEVMVDGTAPSIPVAGSLDEAATYDLPQVLIGAARADELGLAVSDHPRRLLKFEDPLTDRQRDDLSLLADDVNWDPDGSADVYVDLFLPDEPAPLSEGQIRAIAYAALLLLVGAVVAVGLALAAKDDEDENQVLVAVGAPPRTIRRVAALRAGLLVASATVIAVPTGLLSAWAMVLASRQDGLASAAGFVRTLDYRLHPDWITLAFVAVVLPLGVMAVALFGGWLRDLARRPRPLVFALAD